MNEENAGAVALLASIDLAEDDPQIVRTILSMLKAPDYPQLMVSFHNEDTQSSLEKAIKFVNALDKVCSVAHSDPCVVLNLLRPLSGARI